MASETERFEQAFQVLTILRLQRLDKVLDSIRESDYKRYQTNEARVNALVKTAPQLLAVQSQLLAAFPSAQIVSPIQDIKAKARSLYEDFAKREEAELVDKAKTHKVADLPQEAQAVLGLLARVPPQKLTAAFQSGAGEVERLLTNLDLGQQEEEEEPESKQRADDFGLERRALDDQSLYEVAVEEFGGELDENALKRLRKDLGGRNLSAASMHAGVTLATKQMSYERGKEVARRLYTLFVQRKLWEFEDALRFRGDRLKLLHELRLDWDQRVSSQ